MISLDICDCVCLFACKRGRLTLGPIEICDVTSLTFSDLVKLLCSYFTWIFFANSVVRNASSLLRRKIELDYWRVNWKGAKSGVACRWWCNCVDVACALCMLPTRRRSVGPKPTLAGPGSMTVSRWLVDSLVKFNQQRGNHVVATGNRH